MASVGTIKYKNGSSWIDILHPINSFYFSYSSTSPSSLFGGTWTQVTGAAIRGNNSVGYTGSDTHTLTVNEIPSHAHGALLAGLGTDTQVSGFSWDGQAPNSGWWNGYIQVTGGGAAHSIVQRSFNCYIWYRTA